MTDGSNIGTTAGRALKTILGGADQPVEDEKWTPEDLRKRVEECPLPDSEEPIFEGEMTDEAYGKVTDCIAHALLKTTDIADLYGDCGEAWDRAKERWPNLAEWTRRPSGFMVGFAWNTVQYILGGNEQSNPAIVEME